MPALAACLYLVNTATCLSSLARPLHSKTMNHSRSAYSRARRTSLSINYVYSYARRGMTGRNTPHARLRRVTPFFSFGGSLVGVASRRTAREFLTSWRDADTSSRDDLAVRMGRTLVDGHTGGFATNVPRHIQATGTLAICVSSHIRCLKYLSRPLLPPPSVIHGSSYQKAHQNGASSQAAQSILKS